MCNPNNSIDIVKEELNNWKKEFGIEGSVAINAQALENVLSELKNKDKQIELEIKGRDILVNLNTELSKELETWKKIAEKLAEKMIYLPISEDGVFYCTKEAIIDWARNEVENDKQS